MYAIAVGWAFLAQPLEARDLALDALACVGGADSSAEALALGASELDCAEGRFARNDRFVRTHAEVPGGFATASTSLYWQTDPSNYQSMLVRFIYADGQQRLVDVDPQMAVRAWFARTRFSVPVPRSESPLEVVDVVFERPRTIATIRDTRLVTREEARKEHFFRSLTYALICGMLIAPIIFDFLFFRTLRFRFMIWHAAMTFGLLGFVVSNSGLIFQLFPNTPLGVRFQLNTLTLALAIAAAVGFILSLLEEGAVPKWLQRLTIALTALKIVTIIDLEPLRLVSHSAFLASVLPLALGVLGLIAVALFNESRAALYLLISFSGMIIGGVITLAISLGWYRPSYHVDDFLYAAMLLLVLGSSAAVGDRFMVLRVERDRARVNAVKLGRMALSDPLTGLGNRRAFDSVKRLENGQALLVADVDHFKAINDSEGHIVGDTVLRHMASLMRNSFENVEGSTI
ncbi:GGDEF family protein [Erythrobacter sp. SD-21]|nr:GGDEF family protein [Erythrobacter sp. SD-21]